MIEDRIEGVIQDRDIVKEMSESYLNYSMSVIVSRALPDVRDGLKPVPAAAPGQKRDGGSNRGRHQ